VGGRVLRLSIPAARRSQRGAQLAAVVALVGRLTWWSPSSACSRWWSCGRASVDRSQPV